MSIAPLPVTITPHPGESIESWLEHLAAANELNTATLIRLIRDNNPLTTRYLTLAPSTRAATNIARLARVTEDVVRSTSAAGFADTAATADQVELWHAGRPMATMLMTPEQKTSAAINQDIYIEQLELATDLSVVQEAARNRFPMPTSVSNLDRTWARALRLVIEHGHTYAPGITGIHATLRPEALNDPGAMLLDGSPHAMVARHNPFEIELFGHHLTLPEIALYHPALSLSNHERVKDDLTRGKTPKASFDTIDGTNMTLIMHTKYPTEGTPPRPWGLRGVPDPKPLPDRTAPS